MRFYKSIIFFDLLAMTYIALALRCHGLPFDVKIDEPNEVTYAAIESAEKEEDTYGSFDSVSDLMEALK